MAGINIALELFGFIVSVLLLFSCGSVGNWNGQQTKLLVGMLAANAAVLLCDALTWMIRGAQYETLLYALNFFVYSLGYVIAALFTYYLCDYIAQKARVPAWFPRTMGILCAIAVALVVVSLFNHMYFRYVGDVYERGPYYWVSQFYPVMIIVVDTITVFHYRKTLGMHDAITLMTYGALPVIAMLIQIFVYGVTLLYVATTISLLVIYLMIYIRQSRLYKEQEVTMAKNRVAIMLSQIQPHFLYNALGTIQRLCAVDPAVAEKATAEFAMFLRGNMDSITMDKPISFKQELEHTQHYLSLEKLRFPDRLNVVFDIQATMFRLPTLTLQPIVENAVRYGVTKRENGGTVRISACETEQSFLITVEDDGLGFDPMQPHEDGRTHIGIQNVKERLERMCGGTLEIKSTLNVGTVAVITIPKGENS